MAVSPRIPSLPVVGEDLASVALVVRRMREVLIANGLDGRLLPLGGSLGRSSTRIQNLEARALPGIVPLEVQVLDTPVGQVDMEAGYDGLYPTLMMLMTGVTPATDGVDAYLRAKVGGSYIATASYIGSLFDMYGGTYADGGSLTPQSQMYVNLPATTSWGSAAGESGFILVFVDHPTDTTHYKRHFILKGFMSAGAYEVLGISCYRYSAGTDALEGLRLLFTSGNVEAGTFITFGLTS